MKISTLLSAVVLVFSVALWPQAHAALSPVSVAGVPPVQFPPSDFSVTGFRFSGIYGQHRDVYGLDIGLVGNVTENNSTALALSGLFNITHGTTHALGAQVAGLINYNSNKTSVYGFQIASLANVNTAEAKVIGVQLAFANVSAFTSVYGFQLGFYNLAQDVYGFQIGFINRAKSLHGLQIGLVNFNETGLFYVAPVLNVGF